MVTGHHLLRPIPRDNLLFAGLIVALLIGWAVSWRFMPTLDSAVVSCRARYADARTEADTMGVDAQNAFHAGTIAGGNKFRRSISCGALRLEGRTQ